MSQRRLRLLPLLVLLVAASCAVERTVFQERSPYQEVLVTEQARGDDTVRTLRFGSRRGAIQSRAVVGRAEHLLVPYVRATLAGLAFVEDPFGPRKILVVGLGGGSIPLFLHRALPAATIDVVELDPVVVQVAHDWFEVIEDPRLRIHLGDGRRFIEQAGGTAKTERRYDLVVLDAYGERSVPLALTTREFLDAVRDILSPGGAVAANVWASSANPLYGSMMRTYQEVFDELFAFRVPRRSNRIVVALPRAHDAGDEALREALARVSGQLALRTAQELELEELIGRKSPRVTLKQFAGEILVDE